MDTAGWLAYIDRAQPSHMAAVRVVQSALSNHRPLVTTNYVLSELVPLLHARARMSRPQLLQGMQAIRRSPSVQIVHIDEATDREAWDLLAARLDKDWSLVDSASFVVMRKQGLHEVLTTDHHFRQAGFSRLLDP